MIEWAIPQLLRALEGGHVSHRARVLKILGHLEREALEREPVRSVFLRALAGPDERLRRKVARLIARRKLHSYAASLLRLLPGKEVTGWLRVLDRPVEALVTLALDPKADYRARRSALKLLEGKIPESALPRLLPILSDRRFHDPLLDMLDTSLIPAIVDENGRFGEALMAERRRQATGSTEKGLLEKLMASKPSPLGVYPETESEQAGFVTAIAELAIEGGARDWLGKLWPYLVWTGPTARLKQALIAHQVTEVAPHLLAWDVVWNRWDWRGLVIEILGHLGQGADKIAKFLPKPGESASLDGLDALVALARFGEGKRIEAHLTAALALLEGKPEALHESQLGAVLRAAAVLKDARFAKPALALLERGEGPDETSDVLAALDPLELVPALEKALESKKATPWARARALDVVSAQKRRELIKAVVAAARRDPRAARVFRELAGPKDAALAVKLAEKGKLADSDLVRLLSFGIKTFEDTHPLARAVLANGGAKSQEKALGFLGDPAEARKLLLSPHSRVRALALKLALGRGILEQDDATHDLVQAAAFALTKKKARRTLSLLMTAVGVTGELRVKLRQVHRWRSAVTFHALHRELLARPELGLLHGGLLAALAHAQVKHPLTGKMGFYQGPLARLDATFASPSRFVQEGFFDLVASHHYECTDRLLVRFLGSPRPRVRAGILRILQRDATLGYGSSVLARLEDPDSSVRAAAIELLARHDLARFADEVSKRLADQDERVRLLAARTLAVWGDASAVERVASFLDSDDPGRRREAVHALRRFEPEKLAGKIRLGRPRQATAALLALSPTHVPPDPTLHAQIFELAAKGAGPLRALALRFLPAIASRELLPQVVPLLADEDPTVRLAAAYVLRRRDGRRHAPAIAELAARLPSDKSLEVLALLRDLGVPDAARGLLPLLLDKDARVRLTVRDAVTASRGFSLTKDLEGILDRGLETNAPPEAIRELVELLERTGGEDALVAIGRALRYEDRSVWEAVVSAARVHGSDAHAGTMGELLAKTPPLPPNLATLAIGEVERAGRKELVPLLEKLARATPAETVRRKALAAAQVLAKDETSLATEILERSIARVSELAKLKAKKKSDTTREISRQRATITTAGRALLRSHDDVTDGLDRIHDEAFRPLVVSEALERAAIVAAAGPIPGSLRMVLKPVPRDPLGTIAWRVRDRVADFPAKLAELAPREPEKLARAAAAARLLEPRVDLAWHQKMARDPRLEGLYIAAIEHLHPELAPVFPVLVESAKSGIKGNDYIANQVSERLARARLRLGLDTGTEGILELARQVPLRQRILAAFGLVPRLVAELDQKTTDKKLLIPLLGEVGGAEAIRAIDRFAKDGSPQVRTAVARALFLAGVVPREQLRDTDENVLVVALDAAGRLKAKDLGSEVVRLLDHKSALVQRAAAEAAGRLGLAEAQGGLLRLLKTQGAGTQAAGGLPGVLESIQRMTAQGQVPSLQQILAARGQARTPAGAALPAGRALEVTADVGAIPGLLEALQAGVTNDVRESIERILERIIPEPRLDEVGALLGAKNPQAVVAGLRVLGRRKVARALPAVRQLVEQAQPPVRDAAVEAAVALGDREIVPALKKLLEKSPNDVAARAGLEAFEPPSVDELADRAEKGNVAAFTALAARDEAKAALVAESVIPRLLLTNYAKDALVGLGFWIRAHREAWIPRLVAAASAGLASMGGAPGLELLAELAPEKAAPLAASALRGRRIPTPLRAHLIRMVARGGRLADVREALMEPDQEARIAARRFLEKGRFEWEEGP
jgi:HEAT repeat protein